MLKKETQVADLQVFHFGGREGEPFRARLLGDEPCFIAKDLCRVLGISKYRDFIGNLDEDERVSILVDTNGGKQKMTAVNESGFYHCVFLSKHPKAKDFRRWVTLEVLPQLRKTGRYELKPAAPRRYRTRGERVNTDILNLLWLIGESLERGDQQAVALELGVSRVAVSNVLNGYNRSSRILMALYRRARQNREQYLLYNEPRMMAERLLSGEPLPAGNHLPAVRIDGRRGGALGNQNARKDKSKGGK